MRGARKIVRARSSTARNDCMNSSRRVAILIEMTILKRKNLHITTPIQRTEH